MIDHPGIYKGVHLDEYHAQLTPTPSISGSGLVAIDTKSPAHYFAESYLNPNRAGERDTNALRVGRAAHALIVEGEAVFLADHAVKPEGMSFATKEGKAWRAEAEGAGKTIISAAEWRAISSARDAIAEHPLARRAFEESDPEVTVTWRAENGLWLKARPDLLPRDPSRLSFACNLKTTESAKPSDFARSVWSYSYHVGAALTVDLLKALGWHRQPGYFFIAIEKSPPYSLIVATLDEEAEEWGRMQYRRAFETFARCIETARWPSYADDVLQIALPPWARAELQRQSERGEFAPPDPNQPIEPSYLRA